VTVDGPDAGMDLILFDEEVVLAVRLIAPGGAGRVGDGVGELVGVVGDEGVFYVAAT
jgi:hypothetical protein